MINKFKHYFSPDNLSHKINGTWVGESHNMTNFKRKDLPNNFIMEFSLKLKNATNITGNGTITATDDEGTPLSGAKPISMQIIGMYFNSSKIINYYSDDGTYRGSCVLKIKLDTKNFDEEGHAVGYHDADNKVVVSYVQFKQIDNV